MPDTPRYVFFLSYARDDGDAYLDRFYSDLVEMIRLKTGNPLDEIGFRDTQKINLGAQWKSALSEALSSCQCFIPLYSPTYFNREYCGKEWSAFWKRIQRQEGGASFHRLILPVLWTPPGARFEKLSEDIRSIQNVFPQLGALYSKKGLRHLLFLDKEKDNYREFLTSFSDIVLEAISEHSLEPADPALQIEAFPNVFEAAPPPLTLPEQPQAIAVPTDPDFRSRDFLTRVEKVCRLHEPDADVERIHGPGLLADHLRVSVRSGDIVRMYPVAALEEGVTPESFESFLTEIDAWYRRADTGMISSLIYGGAPAPAALVREAVTRRVRLQSFVEYQGLIDFRTYVERQTATLANDRIYPPRLYVPQRMCFRRGQEEEESRDALSTINEWLTSPHGRFALILGDFGTGKTFLLHELARRLGETDTGLIPILLQMRSLEKGRSLDALLAQHFAIEEMEGFSPSKFRYMLEQGRVVLFFDGFDELAVRVTYPKATEHFETLLEAARGSAKVVVTSRRQHFLSDRQVLTVLGERVETLTGNRIGILQPFDPGQIREFLVRYCGGDETKADRRLQLIDRVKDLLGLSRNPRMLGFIAELPEEDLERACEGGGEITAAGLYQLLVDRWLGYEFERVHPKGAPPGLSIEDRWRAVTALALRLWQKTEPYVNLDELSEDTARVIDALERVSLDHAAATFQVGSGTLLVHDGEGNFSFLHQSILEWLVARKAAEEIVSGHSCELLNVRELSLLMLDFLTSLADRKNIISWANAASKSATGEISVRNALALLSRLGEALRAGANLAGQDLRGKDFSGQDLTEADLTGADLDAAKLIKTRLSRARLSEARLVDADLSEALLDGADFTGADLSRARLLGANILGARFDKAVLRRAKLIGIRGATVSTGGDISGAALEIPPNLDCFVSSASGSPAVAWSPDGEILASAEGSVVRLWDIASGREIRALQGHNSSVLSVSFSPDGKALASASDDQTIRLWQVDSGRGIRVLQGHNNSVLSVAFSPDGKALASASGDKTIRLWEVDSGREIRALKGHNNEVHSVAFSPDGKALASGSSDRTIRLWQVDSGRQIRTLKGHDLPVFGVAFSPDGKALASGSHDKTIRLWQVDSGRQICALKGHEHSVHSVAFSPDGKALASGSHDKTIRLWQVDSGRQIRALKGHNNWVLSVAFSPDGKALASGSSDQTIRLWQVDSGREIRALKGHYHGVTSVAFSPDGKALANGSSDQTIRLWQVDSGREIQTLKGHDHGVTSVAFSPNGKALASGSYDNTIRLWQADSGREVRTLKGHDHLVSSVAFSPDGNALASGSDGNTIRLWQVDSGREIRALKGHDHWVSSVAFSPDGKALASGSYSNTIRLWQVDSGREIQVLKGHDKEVRSVAFSPDGKALASGSDDNTIRLWQVDSGREIRALKGHNHLVSSVAFSPDGKTLASGSEDNAVRLWQVSSGREIFSLRGHENGVSTVAFSPDGKLLASGSGDNTIRLWEVATGRCICTLGLLPEGWVAFSPDGRYKYGGVPAGGFWHAINLCRFEAGELDDYVPGLRLADDASFFDLPPAPWVSGNQG
jgi:WD40 repeat protein